ncbi:MAG: MFS transporter, partial [Acidimicrobiales bacterium]
ALAGVQARESGLASALLNTGQQIGGAIGLAALSTIAVTTAWVKLHALAAANHGLVSSHLVAVATTKGYTHSFLIAAAIALGSVAVALSTIRIGGTRPSFGVPRASRSGEAAEKHEVRPVEA